MAATDLTALVRRTDTLPSSGSIQKLSRDEAIRKLGATSSLAKRLGGAIESGHLEAGARRGIQLGASAAGAIANGAAVSILTRRGQNPVAIEGTPITYAGVGGAAVAILAILYGHQMGPWMADGLLGLGQGALAPDLANWARQVIDDAAARQGT